MDLPKQDSWILFSTKKTGENLVLKWDDSEILYRSSLDNFDHYIGKTWWLQSQRLRIEGRWICACQKMFIGSLNVSTIILWRSSVLNKTSPFQRLFYFKSFAWYIMIERLVSKMTICMIVNGTRLSYFPIRS